HFHRVMMQKACPAELPAEEIDTNNHILLSVRVIRNPTQPFANVVVNTQLQNALSGNVLLKRKRSFQGVLVSDPTIILQARRTILLIVIKSDGWFRFTQQGELVSPLFYVAFDRADFFGGTSQQTTPKNVAE